MQLFDTHAHLGLIHDDPIEQLLAVQEAKHVGVQAFVCISNNLDDFADTYEQLGQDPAIHYSVGISPSEVDRLPNGWEARLAKLAGGERVVAIGETGLDYYRKYGDRDSQISLFVRQLEIAERVGLPVVIHNRDAGSDLLAVLRDKLPTRGGVLHCYSEDLEFARRALELNLFISFAGNVTYRSARTLQEVAAAIPLERLLLETETPFMVPASRRGERNRPAYLEETARFVADLRDMPLDRFAAAVFANSQRFFQVSAGGGVAHP
jgi:TatD DNase family protein